ncbi:ubiquitin carboxyl-terminal hydrolase 3-like isoform X2 [Vicugna pacos]|uniref:Ubiquitin carboxyl-terminal hydrolase 3-like isoform X2 n=1 Tax=Vicugna pacos TaxID=30538 RepID=A0ABM5EAC8_VICPA
MQLADFASLSRILDDLTLNLCNSVRSPVCRSSKSPWVCLTSSGVHCGRYVNVMQKKSYEDAQIPLINHKKSEKQEKAQHTVCTDCSSYSTYWSQTSLLSPGICKLSSGVCVVIQLSL